jgi:hypothetical protein
MTYDESDPDFGKLFAFNADVASALGLHAAVVYHYLLCASNQKRQDYQEKERLRKEERARQGKRINRRLGCSIFVPTERISLALPWLAQLALTKALCVLRDSSLLYMDDGEGDDYTPPSAPSICVNTLTEALLGRLKAIKDEKEALDRYLKKHGVTVNS